MKTSFLVEEFQEAL